MSAFNSVVVEEPIFFCCATNAFAEASADSASILEWNFILKLLRCNVVLELINIYERWNMWRSREFFLKEILFFFPAFSLQDRPYLQSGHTSPNKLLTSVSWSLDGADAAAAIHLEDLPHHPFTQKWRVKWGGVNVTQYFPTPFQNPFPLDPVSVPLSRFSKFFGLFCFSSLLLHTVCMYRIFYFDRFILNDVSEKFHLWKHMITKRKPMLKFLKHISGPMLSRFYVMSTVNMVASSSVGKSEKNLILQGP